MTSKYPFRNVSVKSRPRKPEKITIDGKVYTVFASRFCKNKTALLVSDNMTGKMYGFPSISTSCLVNPFCKARLEKGIGICKYCFAEATQKQYKHLQDNCKYNYSVLTKEVLPFSVLPVFCDDIKQARIESFGDVATVEQAINYINIAKLNPRVAVTAWTKNPFIWKRAFDIVGKPDNLTFILSSQHLNAATPVKEKIKDLVDIVFTVYEQGQPVKINCGARDCMSCRRCYTPSLNGSGCRAIAEQLK